jgi:hypothetical protein
MQPTASHECGVSSHAIFIRFCPVLMAENGRRVSPLFLGEDQLVLAGSSLCLVLPSSLSKLLPLAVLRLNCAPDCLRRFKMSYSNERKTVATYFDNIKAHDLANAAVLKFLQHDPKDDSLFAAQNAHLLEKSAMYGFLEELVNHVRLVCLPLAESAHARCRIQGRSGCCTVTPTSCRRRTTSSKWSSNIR